MRRKKIRTDIATERNRSNIRIYLRRRDLRVRVPALGAAERWSVPAEDLLSAKMVMSRENLFGSIHNSREDIVVVYNMVNQFQQTLFHSNLR